MRNTITVKIHNIDQSQPMIFTGVDNTYVKEGFFCIIRRNRNEVQKFPVNRIFRIIEPYLPEDYVQMPEKATRTET